MTARELTFAGKRFLSSHDAAKVAGYAPDYIGQLCRTGKLVCHRVGKSWFVEEESLTAYKALGLNVAPSKALRLAAAKTPEPATRPSPDVAAPVVPERSETPKVNRFSEHTLDGGSSAFRVAASSSPLGAADEADSVYDAPLVPNAPAIPDTLSLKFPSLNRSAEENKFSGVSGKAFSFLSSEFMRKVGTATLSALLVFGGYNVQDTKAVHEAMHVATAVIDAGVDTMSGFAHVLAEPEAARDKLLAGFSSFAAASSDFSDSMFAAASSGVRTSVAEVQSDGEQFAAALANPEALLVAVAAPFDKTLASASEEFSSLKLSASAFGSRVAQSAAATLSSSRPFFETIMLPLRKMALGTYHVVAKIAGRPGAERPSADCVPPKPCAKGDIVMAPEAPAIPDVAMSAGENRTAVKATSALETATSAGTNAAGATSTSASGRPVIIERPVLTERVTVREPSFTEADVDQKLAALQSRLREAVARSGEAEARLSSAIASVRSQTAVNTQATQSNTTYINNVYNTVAQTNNLDRADDLKLGNPTITGGSIANAIVQNIGGTFSSLSGSSLQLANSASIGGDLTVGGLFTSAITATSSISAPYFLATSTAATSTFAGGIAMQTDKFVVESSSGNVGIGSTSPSARLALSGYANATNSLFLISTSTASATSTALIVTSAGNVGLGTSTPSANFSVAGASYISSTGYFGGAVTSAGVFTSLGSLANTFPYASSTAVSVSGTGYFGTASTTNLTVSSLTANRLPFATTAGAFTDDSDLTFTNGNLLTATYASSTALSVSTSAYFATASGNVGVGTTTPWGLLSVNPSLLSGPSFVVGSSTATNFIVTNGGNVGIGTTSPSARLAVMRGTGRAFSVGTATLTDLTVDANGNVGVGLSNPSGRLHVSTDPADAAALILDTNSSASPYAIQFSRNGLSSAYVQLVSSFNLGWTASLNPVSDDNTLFTLGTQALRWNALSVGTGISTFAGNIGIGTTSPKANIGLAGSIGVNASQLVLGANGNVGVGTTSPSGNFALAQRVNGDVMLRGIRATDTASAGDFIQYQSVAGTNLYRVDNSGNVYAGGILSSGAVTITSASTPQFRSQYDSSNEITFASSATGTSTVSVNGGTPKLVFASQTNSLNNYSFTDTGGNAVLSVDTTNGRVGIASTSPRQTFAVQGDALVSGTLSVANFIATSSTITFSGLGTNMLASINNSGNLVATSTPTAAFYLATSTTATSTLAGHLSVQGNATLGDASSDRLTVNAQISSNIVPDGNNTRDLGSLSNYWNNGYFNSMTVNTLGASNTTISGTQNSSFTINSDNASNDAEDDSLVFNRGLVSNAILTWNSTLKNFNFNQPVTVTGNIGAGSTTPAFALSAQGNGYISGSLFVGGTLTATSTGANMLVAANASNQLVSTSTPTAAYYLATSSIASVFPYASSTAITASGSAYFATTGGNVGIGTTSPNWKLSVAGNGSFDDFVRASFFTATSTTATSTVSGGFSVGLCVTGDTRLTRRRRKKKGEKANAAKGEKEEGEYIYDTVQIKDIEAGDEIQSLDEKTGTLVWSRVKQLAYMGTKPIFRLTTASGKTIRTTGNHPYLVAPILPKKAEIAKIEELRRGRHLIPTHSISGDGGQVKNGNASNPRGATGSASNSTKHTPRLGRGVLGRVYAFIDASNIYYGAKKFAYRMDYQKLAQYLRERYGATRIFYYTGLNTRAIGQLGFYAKLERYGYEIRYVPYKLFSKGNDKADVDSRMTFDMRDLAIEFDRAVVLTGDGDYFWVLRYLLQIGKQPILLGYAGRTAKELTRLFGAQFTDLLTVHARLNRMEKTNAADAVKESAAGSTELLYTKAVELSTLLQTVGVDKTSVRAKRHEVERLAEGLLYGLTEDVEFVEKTGEHKTDATLASIFGAAASSQDARPFIKGGIWTKAAEIKEGAEIAVQSKDGTVAVWEKVTNIERLPAEDVYDIEVEGTHNFIGNGIVAHNTAFVVSQSAPANALFVAPNGTVGLGTTTPSKTLAVHGDALVSGTLSVANLIATSSTITFSGLGTHMLTALDGSGNLVSTSTPTLARLIATSSLASLLPYASSTSFTVTSSAFFATASGNVGIATTSPGSLLSVQGNGYLSGNLFVGGTLTATSSTITFSGLGTNLLASINNSGNLVSTSTPTAAYYLATSSIASIFPYASTTALTASGSAYFATSGGNVGVGTTSPTQPLSVSSSGGNSAYFAGNVGIGTNNPTIPMDIRGTAGNTLLNTQSDGGYRIALRPDQSGVGDIMSAKSGTVGTQLSFSTQSSSGSLTERLRIDSSGNVGVGTTTPNNRLTLYNTTTPALEFAAASAAGANWTMGVDTADGMKFKIASSTAVGTNARLTIDTNGNVGLGTTGPGAKLDVGGAATNVLVSTAVAVNGSINSSAAVRSVDATTGNVIQFSHDGTIGKFGTSYLAGSTDTPIGFYITNSEKMRITTAGNVGVGTTSPGTTFAVQGNGLISGNLSVAGITATSSTITFSGLGTNMLASINNSGNLVATSTPTAAYYLATSTTATSTLAGYLSTAQFANTAMTTGSIPFYGAGGFEKQDNSNLFWDAANARLGIGTNAPATTLDILASANGVRGINVVNASTGSSAEARVTVSNGSSAGFISTAGTSYGGYGAYTASSTMLYNASTAGLVLMADNGSGIIKFATGGNSEKVRIDSSGNLGVGTSSPASLFSVAGAGYFIGNVGIGVANPGQNLVIQNALAETNLYVRNTSSTGDGAIRVNNDANNPLDINNYGSSYAGADLVASLNRAGLSTIASQATNGLVLDAYASAPLYFATNHVERMRIDSSGNVGIGTTTPALRLDIAAAGPSQFRIESTDAGGGTGIQFTDAAGSGKTNWYIGRQNHVGGLEFTPSTAADGTTFSTPKMVILDGGSVGVGTTGPLSKLDVNGGVAIGTYAGANAAPSNGLLVSGNIEFGNTTAVPVTGFADQIGLGFTASNGQLQVAASSVTPFELGRINTTGVLLNFRHNNNNVGAITTDGTMMELYATSTLVFGSNGTTERMRITTGGNVGIGTTTPDTTLSVNGTTKLGNGAWPTSSLGAVSGNRVGIFSSSETGYLFLGDMQAGVGADRGGQIYLGARATTGAFDFAQTIITGARETASSGNSTSYLAFSTSNSGGTASEKVRITSSGNVGVGTTSPASYINSANAKNLDITGAGQAAVILHDTASAQETSLLAATDGLYIDVAGSATATNNKIHFRVGGTNSSYTPTEKMTIQSDGNVGLGATSPKAKLEIDSPNGAAASSGATQTNGGWLINPTGDVSLAAGVNATSNYGWLQAGDIRDLSVNYSIALQPNGGNVGIGTTSPLSKLAVSGGASVGADYNIAAPTNGMIIQGNVGIGTTAPGEKLDVSGSTTASTNIFGVGTDASDVALLVKSPGTSAGTYNASGGTGVLNIGAATSGNQSYSIYARGGAILAATLGNVGIGTTSPQDILDVSGSLNGAGIARITNTSNGTSASAALRFHNLTDSTVAYVGFGGPSRVTYVNLGANILSMYTDNTAGMSFLVDAAGPMSFATNALQRMTILSGGNVGIGTTSPGKKLDVVGNIRLYDSAVSGSGELFVGNNGISNGSSYINLVGSNSDTNWQIATNNNVGGDFEIIPSTAGGGTTFTTPALTILKTSGNIGIGTTGPGAKLHVSGGQILLDNTNTLQWKNAAGTIRTVLQMYSDNNVYLDATDGDVAFRPGGSQTVVFKNGGNVGIGTTGPDTKLHVVSGSEQTNTILTGNLADFTGPGLVPLTDGSRAPGNLTIYSNTAFAKDIGSSIVMGGTYRSALPLAATGFASLFAAKENATDNELSGYLAIYTNRAATQTEAMRITSSGNVGIGTTSPYKTLDVAGSLAASGAISFPGLDTTNNENVDDGILIKRADGTIMTDSTLLFNPGGDSMSVGSGPIVLSGSTVRSSGTNKLILKNADDTTATLINPSGGNVGIGITTPGATLDVQGASSITNLGDSMAILAGNDGGGAGTLAQIGLGYSSRAAGQYPPVIIGSRVTSSSGQSQQDFFVAARNSTVGTTRPTELFTVKSAGNVGIGTTSPTQLLSVSSSSGNSAYFAGNVGIGVSSPSVALDIAGILRASGGAFNGNIQTGTTATPSNGTELARLNLTGNGCGNTVYAGASIRAYGSATTWSGTSGGTDLAFLTTIDNGCTAAERVRFTNAGNVGIGTSTPAQKLNIFSSSEASLRLESSAASSQVGRLEAYNNNTRIGTLAFGLSYNSASTGDIILSEDKSSQRIYVQNNGSGGVYLTDGATSWTSNSDERLKENIATLGSSSGLSSIMALNPVSFNWKDVPQNAAQGGQLGFLAQEVKNVFPELVTQGGIVTIRHADGTTETVSDVYGLNITGLIPPMVKAIQEVGERIGINSNASTSTPSLYITASSTVAIGTTTPDTAYALYVNGDAAATSFVNISTRTAKKDIAYLADDDKRSVSDKIRNIKIAEYRYNGESEAAPLRLGLIAEEAPAEVLSANGKGVDVYKFATFLLTGVQNLDARLTADELRITKLETLVASSTPNLQLTTNNLQLFTDYLASLGAKIENGIATFASVVTDKLSAHLVVVNRVEAETVSVSNGLELKDSATGAVYCVRITNGEFAKIAGGCGASVGASDSPKLGESDAPTPQSGGGDTTPPVITVIGNNPATITKGSVYADLGASVTDNVSTNLGVHTFGLDAIDTSLSTGSGQATTTSYIITYTATDGAGNTATSTRTVIVTDPVNSSQSSSNGASTASATQAPHDEATSTPTPTPTSTTETAAATSTPDTTTATSTPETP